MTPKLCIYWSRRDFRLTDNPALWEAVDYSLKNNILFIPIYILDTEILKTNVGYSRKLFLSKVLASFAKQFTNFWITCGKPVDIFEKICENWHVEIFCNDDIEQYSLKRDDEVDQILAKYGKKLHSFQDQLTISKDTVSGTGSVYTMFTPFKNSVVENFLSSKIYPKANIKDAIYISNQSKLELNRLEIKTIDSSNNEKELQQDIFQKIDGKVNIQLKNRAQTVSFTLDLDQYFPRPKLDTWSFSEYETLDLFDKFNQEKILNYKDGRDNLELEDGTSSMSTALKWGLVSSRTLKDKILKLYPETQSLLSQKIPREEQTGIMSYISELIWREFYKYILYHFPESLHTEFQSKFRNKIAWVDPETAFYRFQAWIRGETGYPLVDAAMQQIAQTGWMHNRTRMLVASVLTKNLGVDWLWGQEYFRQVLIDLDEASNNGGWQWAASTGADPKPIRIFNPYLQAEKYDPNGTYQKKWLPEDYDVWQPIVDHKQARQEALIRYGLVDKGVRDY
jgi:deoxyribodipyrimidine photo-lyase